MFYNNDLITLLGDPALTKFADETLCSNNVALEDLVPKRIFLLIRLAFAVLTLSSFAFLSFMSFFIEIVDNLI